MRFLYLIFLIIPVSSFGWYNTNYVPVGYPYPAFWAGAGLQRTVTYAWSNNWRLYVPSYVFSQTIATNVTGVDNTGATDVTATLQAIYNGMTGASGAEQVMVLPAGTFQINSTLIFNRDFNSVRGTIVPVSGVGSNATVFLYSTNNSPGPHVLTVGRKDGTGTGNTFDYQYTQNHTNLLFSDALRGSSNIVLSSAALADLGVGDKFLIDRLPDGTNTVYTYNGLEPPVYDQCPGANLSFGTLITWGSRVGSVVNSNRICAELHQVTAVANTTNITFWPPLYAAFSNSYSPNVIKAFGLSTNIFLEAVTVDMNQAIRSPGWGWNGIYFIGTYQCGMWNVNVVQTNGPQTTMHVYGGLWSQIEHSFVTLDGTVSGNSQAYGIYCVTPHTAFAFINNIFGTNEVAIGEEGGDSGDVIYGNLMNNLVYSDSGQTKRDWGPAHGGFNHMNLIEQNMCPQSYLDVDNYQGNHSTLYFFKNAALTATNSLAVGAFTCFEDWGINWYCTVQGNFFGQTNVETLRYRTGGNYNSGNYIPGSANPPVVYHFGYQSSIANNGVSTDFTFNYMTNAPYTEVHENWEYPNNSINYDPNIADHTSPDSLYLSGPPTWWGNLNYPGITNSTLPSVTAIPAGYRFSNGTLPPNSYFFGPDPSPPAVTTVQTAQITSATIGTATIAK